MAPGRLGDEEPMNGTPSGGLGRATVRPAREGRTDYGAR
jgi:hypothetical protein